MTPTVYRCFDKDGRLIYVGFTVNCTRRLKQHRAASPWFGLVGRVTHQTFDTKAAALAEERRAIRAEGPLCNAKGNAAQDGALMAKLRRAPRKPTHHIADAPDVVVAAVELVTTLRKRLSVLKQEEDAVFAQARARGVTTKLLRGILDARSKTALGMA